MNARTPSVELSAFTIAEQRNINLAQKKVNEVENSAKTLGVSVEKFEEMQNYAAKLRKKFPSMKPERVSRKVAEHFKIKLV